MRALYTQMHFEKLNREYPAFLDRKLVEWIYEAEDGTIISTKCRAHAEFLKACRGGLVSLDRRILIRTSHNMLLNSSGSVGCEHISM
jgi:hypothetical protein